MSKQDRLGDVIVATFWKYNMVHVDAAGESHIVGRSLSWAQYPFPVIVDEREPIGTLSFTDGDDGSLRWGILGVQVDELPQPDLTMLPPEPPDRTLGGKR